LRHRAPFRLEHGLPTPNAGDKLARMFRLDSYLESRRKSVEAALDFILPSADTPPARLHEAMRYAVFSGGKRVRPVLCVAAADAVADKAPHAAEAAAAVELFHTYTLIHDDLPCMDDDDMRRGRPTCHVAFGEATAVLAGDALQCLAFGVLADAGMEPGVSSALARELASAGGSMGVAGGQAEDLAATVAGATVESVARIHLLKSAALIAAATRMGGIAAGASAAQTDALGAYGEKVGMAFQMADDLLDSERGEAGGETSCLSVMSAEDARERIAALTTEAVAALARHLPADRTVPLKAMAEWLAGRKA